MSKNYRSNWSITYEASASRFVLRTTDGSDSLRQLFSVKAYGSRLKAEAAALEAASSFVKALAGSANKLVRRQRTAARRESRKLMEQKTLTSLLTIVDERHGFNALMLVHFMSRYGHRVITMCKITAEDWDGSTLTVHVKDTKNGDAKPHQHYVFPDDAELLNRLCDGLQAHQRVFLDPRKNKPWKLDPSVRGTGRSEALERWLRKLIEEVGHTGAISTINLKDYAWHAMRQGLSPWPKVMTPNECAAITGHQDAEKIDKNYNARNMIMSQELTKGYVNQ